MRNTKLVKKKLKIINDDNIDKEELEKIKNEKVNDDKLVIEYVNTLDEFELQAMDIAKRMLESSFDIEKSIGFLEFKKKQ